MTTKVVVVSTLSISLISFLITVALCVHFYQGNYPGTDTGDFALGLILLFFLPIWAIAAVFVAGLVFIFVGLSSKWGDREKN